MTRILFVGYLEEQRSGMIGQRFRRKIRLRSQCANARIVEKRQLVIHDGHIASARGRCRVTHLFGQRRRLGQGATTRKVGAEGLIVSVGVLQDFGEVEEIEFLLGHLILVVQGIL